jgi:hypothetical protein
MLTTSIHAAQPTVSATLAGGLASVMTREVPMVITSPDWVTGLANVRQMQVWGDIDPGFRPEAIGAGVWTDFVGAMTIVLSAGAGPKTINVKVRNYSLVESAVAECETVLACAPHASVLWTDQRVVTSPTGQRQFGWSSSHDWTRMALTLSPTDNASFEDCSPFLYNTDGGLAGAHVFETIDASDVLGASPYPGRSGVRILSLFIEVNGSWWGTPFRWGESS